MTNNGKVRVLIVDDSAFMCRVLESIFRADPQMEVVGTARDGREAVSMAEALRPDVVTMDINMPHMDGLQATEVIMSTNPRPIVMVSSESRDGAEPTLKALQLGAIDFVTKPSAAIDLDMNTVREELSRKVKIASKVRVVRTATRPTMSNQAPLDTPAAMAAAARANAPAVSRATTSVSTAAGTAPQKGGGSFPVIMLAASTGGPQTLMNFVPAFPANFPGAVLLVQHMPGAFTSQFAAQLGQASKLKVKEAEQGELLRPGMIYVCPGSHHMRVSPTGRITLDDGPRVEGYKPCANLTMETMATYAGPMGIGVVLTGMGTDGTKGAQAIKAAGGHVIAQDEATSVIFGMPAEAIKAGAVDQVLPIDQIYAAIEKRVLYVYGASRVGAL
jgi:two-component system, chemotaxis family, protein-glutamate methylesterase/glutaminase